MNEGIPDIKKIAALAPMAGVADRAMRELCMEYGAAYCTSEMTSAKGFTLDDRKSASLLTLTPRERPGGVQLFGDSPETMAQAAVKSLDFSPDFIDINMGCPAPKVAGNGGGSALMKRPELAAEIVRACTEAVSLPVTVKMRAGWDSESINAPLLARLCEEAGAAAITVHGRTRVQMYAPPVDYAVIAKVKRSVSIPVIGNGDVCDGKSAEKMMRDTGCDMVALGRAALGRPWIFRQINEYFSTGEVLPEPPVEERMDVMLRHISALIAYKGEHIGVLESRKHSAWYLKGIRGAAALRRETGSLTSFEELKALAQKVIRLSREDSQA